MHSTPDRGLQSPHHHVIKHIQLEHCIPISAAMIMIYVQPTSKFVDFHNKKSNILLVEMPQTVLNFQNRETLI
jgi:hypothetical protein